MSQLRARRRALWLPSVLLPSVLLLLCGCGFHLRGEPMRAAAANADRPAVLLQIDRARTPLGVAVTAALRDGDVALAAAADSAAGPSWQVRVSDQQEERRSRTLTRGIQVAEYELTVGLDFVVLDAQGNQLHPTQRLSASRVYEREQENLLTNEAEEDVLLDELRRDVAVQLAAAVAVQVRAAPRPATESASTGG